MAVNQVEWLFMVLLGVVGARAQDMTMALCGVANAGWAVQDNMGLFLGLHYWASGPSSLAGGLPRPANPLPFNISVVPLDSGCSPSTSFNSAMSVFTSQSVDVINGCVCSSASLQVGRFSTALNVPMMATTSQSSLLSDKGDYPYLFRWCTTEITDADMHASLLAGFGLIRYSVMYYDMVKNNLAKDSLLANPSVSGMTAHVVRMDDLDMNIASNYAQTKAAMGSMRKFDSWVLIFYLSTDAGEHNKDLGLQIAVELGILNNYSVAMVEETLLSRLSGTQGLADWIRVTMIGSIVGRAKPIQARHDAFKQWMSTVDLQTLRALGFDPTGIADQDWLTNAVTRSAPWHAFRMDATIGLLMVLQDLMLAQKPLTSQAIFDGIKNLPLKGIMGDVSWDVNLNRQGLVYQILQLQWTDDTMTWPALLKEVGETVLTPDENGVVSATLDTSALRFQSSGPGQPPRRTLAYPVAPPCDEGWSKPDAYAKPEECSPCPQGTFGSEATANSCIECQSGLFGNGEGASRCDACQYGTYSNTSGASACYECSKGSAIALSGATECEACLPGAAAAADGLSECAPCAPGRYAADASQSYCEECDIGFAQVAPGSTACQACPAGRYAGAKGTSECVFCEDGTFQDAGGASACKQCQAFVPGSGTENRVGSTLESDCVCSAGFMLHRETAADAGRCIACPEGIICPGGKDPLRQEEGYQVGTQAYVGAMPDPRVLCADLEKCPAGRLLGECPSHRTGRGCDECEAGYTPSSGSHCDKCEGGAVLIPSIIFLFVGGVVIICLTIYAVIEVNVQRQSVITAVLACGLVLNAVQTVSVFSQLSIEWVEPLKSLSTIMNLFVFNVEVLQLDCVFSTSNPGVMYMTSLLIFPGIVVLQILAFVLLKLCLPWIQVDKHRVLNVIGLLFLIAYLSLSINALVPWQCQDNPDGTSSVQTYRSILCYEEGAHITMLAFSVMGILVYIVGFLSIVIWATVMYPERVAGPGGPSFLRRFQFLFNRFMPSRYYYGSFFVFRNFLIALMPVALVNEPQAQILCLCLIISAAAAVENLLKPWRVLLANVVSATFSVGLNLMLCAGSILLPSDTDNAQDVIQGFLIAIFVVTFGLAIVVALLYIHQALFPSKPYGIFLCHHKGGAGVLARLFKLVLSERCNCRIFIDSDELDNLSLLFDVVAHKTRNLIVLLTQQTLARMWCAGEVTTAMRCGVHTVPVAADDYVPPTDAFIENLPGTWKDAEKAELSSLGIVIHHIQDAFRTFRQMELVDYSRTLRFEEQEQLMITIATKCKQIRVNSAAAQAASKLEEDDAEIAIVGDDSDPEAGCISQVLRRLIMKNMQRVVHVIHKPEDSRKQWEHVLAVLTRGVLDTSLFAYTLVLAKDNRSEVIGINADTSFQFPGQEYWVKMRKGEMEALKSPLFKDIGLLKVLDCYKSLFRGIAKVFSPKGSERVQSAEVDDMARRLLAKGVKRSISIRGAGSSRNDGSSRCEGEFDVSREATEDFAGGHKKQQGGAGLHTSTYTGSGASSVGDASESVGIIWDAEV